MSASSELHHEIEQMLFHEASLLDEHRYDEWLKLLTDDVTYWMPIRSARLPGQEADEFTRPGDAALFDETRALLEARIYKLATGFAWSEDPRSRTRHIVSNLRLLEVTDDEVVATCNFIVYRSRLQTDEDLWVGRRVDRLRKVDQTWKIARREIYLDQTVLKSKNLSTFF